MAPRRGSTARMTGGTPRGKLVPMGVSSTSENGSALNLRR